MRSSRLTVNTCVTTTTKDIKVTVRGNAGEAWPAKGYARIKLRRSSNASEVWIDVDSKKLGYWADASHNPKTITFSNIAYIGA